MSRSVRVPLHAILAGLCLLSAMAAFAETTPTPVNTGSLLNPLVALVPGLGEMPGPPWIKDGLRVTYNSRAASIPDISVYLYKAPNGQHKGGEQPGFGGAGILQFTTIARDKGRIISAGMSYTVDINTGNLSPSPVGVAVDTPGAGAIWTSPQGLALAGAVKMKKLTIVKGAYPLNGETFDSITFHWVNDDTIIDRLVESVAEATYDLASGLQLFSSHIVQNLGEYRAQYTQSEYAGRRYLQLPWQAKAAPAWAEQVRRLEYRGAVVLQLVGTPNIPMPYSEVFERTDGGPNWTAYTATRYLQGQYNTSAQVGCGVGGLPGGPWMPPEALQALQPGQLLDSDPITGVKVSVDRIVPGPNGTELMGFVTTMRGTTLIHAYDRSNGRLIFIRETQQIGLASQITELTLASAT